ncbi:MAG: sigma-70 family RNA polymerase sigma factor [Rhizobiaceae bacterium]
MGGTDEQEMAALLRAALGGDEKAYERFLGSATALVRDYARRRIVHGGIEAEDIVQETLLALHLKRHTWLTDAPVLPWLYAIARHKLIDAFRRRGHRVDIDIDDMAGSLAQPERETISDRDIGRALDALAPGQRTVVAAISVQGESIGEAASRLGMSETAVRVALHRGLTAIAKRFGRD